MFYKCLFLFKRTYSLLLDSYIDIARIMQEPVLFSVSVGENIAYGLPDDDVSMDDVIKAAKAANAHDFILSLPQVHLPNHPS